jgi:hypothetical protein
VGLSYFREGIMKLYEIRPNHWVNLEFIAGLKYERTGPAVNEKTGKVSITHSLAVTFAKGEDAVVTGVAEIRKFSEFAGIADPTVRTI